MKLNVIFIIGTFCTQCSLYAKDLHKINSAKIIALFELRHLNSSLWLRGYFQSLVTWGGDSGFLRYVMPSLRNVDSPCPSGCPYTIVHTGNAKCTYIVYKNAHEVGKKK